MQTPIFLPPQNGQVYPYPPAPTDFPQDGQGYPFPVPPEATLSFRNGGQMFASSRTVGSPNGGQVFESTSTAGPIARTHSVELDDLPTEVRNILKVYDIDKDGVLHKTDLEFMAQRITDEQEGRMSFKTFPPKDREVLSEFDANGDEKLDTAEISSAFRALKWERDKNASLVRYLTILGVFSIIMLTAFAGLTALVVHEMKDTKVNNDVLLSMQDMPIQTANTDFEMTTDGALQSRPFSSDGICVGDTSGCQRTRVTVAAVPKTENAVLSSALSDEDLINLEKITIRQQEAFIHVKISAVARYTESASRFGSVVVLYSALGELTLDGEAIFFHESLEGAFSRAGFTVDTDGRRFLGIVQILGLFTSFHKIGSNASLGNTSDSDPQFDLSNLALTFIADVTAIQICDGETCYMDGEPFDYAQDMPDGKRALVNTEKHYSQTINGHFVTKTIVTSPQWPSQERVVVHNASHRLSYQLYDGHTYHCKIQEDSSLQDSLTRRSMTRRVGSKTSGVSKFEFAGYVTVNGRYCRHVKICEQLKVAPQNATSSAKQTDPEDEYTVTDFCYDVFEDYFKKSVYRLVADQLITQFDSFHEIPSEANNPLPPGEFDIGNLHTACDSSRGRTPPREWVPGEVTASTVHPKPSWGKFRGTKLSDILDTILSSLNVTLNGTETGGDARRRSSGQPSSQIPEEDAPRISELTIDEYFAGGRRAEVCTEVVSKTPNTLGVVPIGASQTNAYSACDKGENGKYLFDNFLFTERSFWFSVPIWKCPAGELSVYIRDYKNGDVEWAVNGRLDFCVLGCVGAATVPAAGSGLILMAISATGNDLCAFGSVGVGRTTAREDYDDEAWDARMEQIWEGGINKDDVEAFAERLTASPKKSHPRRPLVGDFRATMINFDAGAYMQTLSVPGMSKVKVEAGLRWRFLHPTEQGDFWLWDSNPDDLDGPVQQLPEIDPAEPGPPTITVNDVPAWSPVAFRADMYVSVVTHFTFWSKHWEWSKGLLPGSQKPSKECEWTNNNQAPDYQDSTLQKSCRWNHEKDSETFTYDYHNANDGGNRYLMSWTLDNHDPLNCPKNRNKLCSHRRGDWEDNWKEAGLRRYLRNTWYTNQEEDRLWSSNSEFFGVMQDDCYFGVYQSSPRKVMYRTAGYWVSKNSGDRPCKMRIGDNQDVVIKNRHGKTVWTAGTSLSLANRVVLTNDGRLEIRSDWGLVKSFYAGDKNIFAP